MKLRVDYQEIKQAICKDVAARLSIDKATATRIRVVSITRGKGENVWADVEINIDKVDQ